MMTYHNLQFILATFRLPFLSGLAETFALHDTGPDLIDKDIQLFLKHELSGLASVDLQVMR